MSRHRPVGPLGMGGAPLGNLFEVVPEAAARETLATAWAAGIRHYDTAPLYGFGLSERRMGDGLRPHPRAGYTLSTKVGRLLHPEPEAARVEHGFVEGLPFRFRFDYSGPAARRSIEDSLQRLGLASIDIVYLHDLAEDWLGADFKRHFADAMAGAAKELTALREKGVIKAWGLGVNLVEPCLAALEQADPDVFLVAGRYSLLDHTALAKLFPACANRSVSVVIGGPYNSGLLAGGDTFDYQKAPAERVARARAMGEVCKRHGVDLKAAALQFCAAHPVVATVIPGARTPAEVAENARLMAAPIPAALWADLKKGGLLPADVPVPAA